MSNHFTENKGLKGCMDMYKENLDEELYWMKDNDFIHRGYRSQLTFRECIVRYSSLPRLMNSLFRSTNETINIWSHVFGAVLFIGILNLTPHLPSTTTLLHEGKS